MNNYKSGFQLINVHCANCAFDADSMDFETEKIIYPLKENLFDKMAELHDEDVKVQKGKYKCKGRKLTVSFCFAMSES